MVARRFDVCLVNLDPTVGSKIRKTRPYSTHVHCQLQGKKGQVVLDQLRTVDKGRLVRRLGRLSAATQKRVPAIPAEMFTD